MTREKSPLMTQRRARLRDDGENTTARRPRPPRSAPEVAGEVVPSVSPPWATVENGVVAPMGHDSVVVDELSVLEVVVV